MKATFPEGAAGQPVVYEQALVGISDEGDAAVVQLIDAEGAEPRLSLLVFARGGGPTRAIRSSLAPTARAVAERVRQARSEEHTSELQSLAYLVCRLLLE